MQKLSLVLDGIADATLLQSDTPFKRGPAVDTVMGAFRLQSEGPCAILLGIIS
jgi:hypothetical protein